MTVTRTFQDEVKDRMELTARGRQAIKDQTIIWLWCSREEVCVEAGLFDANDEDGPHVLLVRYEGMKPKMIAHRDALEWSTKTILRLGHSTLRENKVLVDVAYAVKRWIHG